jgi:DNA-binding NarL/FixJ family response regulator
MISTIGLIDKNVIIRLGIGVIISKNFGSKILEADNLTTYQALHADQRPDILILGNYGTPQECFETTKKAKELFPILPIVVYDENENFDLALMYLKLGVSAYLRKSYLTDEILPCLRGVMIGEKYLSPSMLQNLLSSLRGHGKRSESFATLTERETQIANLLCKGMRTKNIAHALQRKPSTISTIKHTIFRKLQVKNILELSKALGHQNQLDTQNFHSDKIS